MKVSEFAALLGQTLKSTFKIILLSKATRRIKVENATSAPLIILANGPSLRKTIDEHGQWLAEHTTLAVNFAANAPEFKMLRPRYYVLADPHFFKATSDPDVRRLLDNLASADWPMTIFIDRRYRKLFLSATSLPQNVDYRCFNGVGAEGFASFERTVYRTGLAMPRPRNVLIPSIMTALRLGYRTVYLCGADHSWMRDITVTSDNEVVSALSHFYMDTKTETTRTINEYKGYTLDQILFSLYTAFKSYHKIERFARRSGVEIINATQGSYIDAFRRAPLPS